MTDSQINAAIAEACGWKEVRVNGGAGVYKDSIMAQSCGQTFQTTALT